VNPPFWIYAVRAAVIMAFLFVAFRVFGKRMASQMNIYDLAMIMAVSNAVQNAMTGGRGELAVGLYTSTSIIVLAYLLTRLFIRAPKLEQRLIGKPTLIISNGVLLPDRLRKERLTEDEVMEALRQHGLTKPDEVQMAVFEVDGSISVVPKKGSSGDGGGKKKKA
jgi:uncharacterized membrane protein YcaP (DUF421 family)